MTPTQQVCGNCTAGGKGQGTFGYGVALPITNFEKYVDIGNTCVEQV